MSISPIIDHLFKPLDKDKINRRDTDILFEIIAQVIVLALMWYLLSEIIISYINNKLNIRGHPLLNKTKEVIGAVVMIGLQKNLSLKLNYVTKKHPIRNLIIN